MKYIKAISAMFLCICMSACSTTQPSKLLTEEGESTAVQTGLNSPEHNDDEVIEQTTAQNAEFTLSEGTISLYIPEDSWSASLEDDKVVITPEDYEETWLYIYFYDQFATCGTGLEQKKVTINDRSAICGYFDGKSWWDYTVFGDFGTMQLVVTKVGLHWDEKILNQTAELILQSITIH